MKALDRSRGRGAGWTSRQVPRLTGLLGGAAGLLNFNETRQTAKQVTSREVQGLLARVRDELAGSEGTVNFSLSETTSVAQPERASRNIVKAEALDPMNPAVMMAYCTRWMAEGSGGPVTGTEYEFEDALNGRDGVRPALFVYRKTGIPQFTDERQILEYARPSRAA